MMQKAEILLDKGRTIFIWQKEGERCGHLYSNYIYHFIISVSLHTPYTNDHAKMKNIYIFIS